MTQESLTDVLNDALTYSGRTSAAKATDQNLALLFLNRCLKKFWEFAWWPGITHVEPRHFAPVWSSAGGYITGDVVYYPATNQHYECLGTGGTEPVDSDNNINAQHWATSATEFTASDWDSTKTYAQGDLVTLRSTGRVYQSRVDSNTLTPVGNDGAWGIRTPFHWRIDFEQSEPARALDASPSVAYVSPKAFVYGNQEVPLEPGAAILLQNVTDQEWNGLWQSDVQEWRGTDIIFTPGINLASTSTNGTVTTWRRPVGHVRNIFASDPRHHGFNAGHKATRLVNGFVSPLRQGTVWLEYRERVPVMSNTAYSATTAYSADDTMLFTDGHCYQAVLATTAGQSPATHPGKWRKQFIPGYLREALALGVSGSLKEHHNGNQDGAIDRNRAQAELRSQIRELQIDQSQTRNIRVPWASQPSGNGQRVAA